MATFARSFKPPSYLSPRRRPPMAGRTLSNSSELSLASTTSGRSDDVGDSAASSRPTTPSHLGLNPASMAASAGAEDSRAVTSGKSSSNASSSRSNSRPIAIELPKMRKINSAPVYTPPEPLSARGDLPGGYFPLHEDPKSRVHRPHPFHHRATDSNADTKPTNTAAASFKSSGSNMPVASYIAPGFHENPVPMGKYYPTNYEMRKTSHKNLRPSVSGATMSSSIKSETHASNANSDSPQSSVEDDTRRKMQQYQRDMIMQATLALGSSTANASQLAAGASIHGVELRLTSVGAHKPKSPRLAPLGSPGPVTPMELESASGSYLDKGNSAESRNRTSLAPPAINYTTST